MRSRVLIRPLDSDLDYTSKIQIRMLTVLLFLLEDTLLLQFNFLFLIHVPHSLNSTKILQQKQ